MKRGGIDMTFNNEFLILDSYNQTSFFEFVEAIKLGREIEFNLKGHNYFLQPYYESNNLIAFPIYVLYDCKNNHNSISIFSGTKDELLYYQFTNGMTLKNDFHEFSIDWIL